MSSNGGAGQRGGDKDSIIGALRQLLLEQEQRFDAKINQITGEMRQTLDWFHRKHVAAERLNPQPVERVPLGRR